MKRTLIVVVGIIIGILVMFFVAVGAKDPKINNQKSNRAGVAAQ